MSVQMHIGLPVFCGVGYSGDELDRFGVVVNPCVQSQILLDKVFRGHEPFAILVLYTGVLTKEKRRMTLFRTTQALRFYLFKFFGSHTEKRE